MTEEDIKLNFITPAIAKSSWQNKITMETKVQFTDGRINLKGNAAVREKPKKADYILYLNANNSIAKRIVIQYGYLRFADTRKGR